MGKIFCVIGKSSSGKDTIFKQILEKNTVGLKTIVPYTTRPIRDGETNGIEYFFINEKELENLERDNKIIELRAYHTVHGIWKYFTAHDEQIDLVSNNYIMIGTLDSYMKLKEFFGDKKVRPIYIELEDGIRLTRAIEREKLQENPKYSEMCRRFLADAQDFSEENIKKAGVVRRFENQDLSQIVEDIIQYIVQEIK
ncbi:nucleoside/nucleotide kinase family protein [Anaerosacchariphilus polymeriproducens]|uniref:Guanylate kinase n=1 Tax=Anaerosacchariphilus polymeriproducens TaxID=1812858 RepID=A0A371ATE6_9FIRM|nr:guanylate kinase [Anaerosacchariphilus polymeriproducens]RDU22844.1 guanylate kinase [Anaerosacchariphilus polymeriproducens]